MAGERASIAQASGAAIRVASRTRVYLVALPVLFPRLYVARPKPVERAKASPPSSSNEPVRASQAGERREIMKDPFSAAEMR